MRAEFGFNSPFQGADCLFNHYSHLDKICFLSRYFEAGDTQSFLSVGSQFALKLEPFTVLS